MRKLMIVAVSALTLGGVSLAQAQETGQTPAAPTTAAPMPGMNTPADTYGSYANRPTKDFAGTITGNYSADSLVGRNIVDTNNASVGEVNDLLMGSDGNIQNVLVDVGGFLGIGARTVSINLDDLKVHEGDENGPLVVSMTKEQMQQLPEYKKNDNMWNLVKP